jgi:2-polyprenyl-6-methoxyphenol hydroxylase-like FAD-dependent oxidoreductase
MNPSVLLIGAGPVGLTMAAELARYGISVRIIDKAAGRTDKSKPLVLWIISFSTVSDGGAEPLSEKNLCLASCSLGSSCP